MVEHENIRCECHGHIMMDGSSFYAAQKRHKNGVVKETVREAFASLQASGIHYFRDGGDALHVSTYAAGIAGEYGIRYVTPAFAIHKIGHYGGIVGRAFSDMTDYRERLSEIRGEGGTFAKLVFSGILTFQNYGELSCPELTAEEIREMVHIAHEEGFAVMAHVNSDRALRAAIEAGTDSIEHGYFMTQETLDCLAESDTIWVPTLAAIEAFIGRDPFDEETSRKTLYLQMEALRYAADRGALIACGSDSGAVGVPHGHGTIREEELLRKAGLTPEIINRGNAALMARFPGSGS